MPTACVGHAVTADDRRVERVLERDDATCQRCGDRRDSAALLAHSVGSSVDEGHPASLVTVCEGCAAPLEIRPREGADEPSTRDRFRALRAFTIAQSEVIADVTALVECGTSLPTRDADDAREAYCAARRTVLLAFDLLDARLETVASGDGLAADAAGAVADFREAAEQLQTDLRAVVEAIERIVTALERCHVCFEPRGAADRCSSCEVPVLEFEGPAADADGFDALFRSVDERLRAASASTERVTDRATAAADALVG